ncbi:MAG: hypothetical protein ACF8MJ_01655 [Phycisphaerales bacterium JB050]
MKTSIATAMIAATVGIVGSSASAQSVSFDFTGPVPLASSQTPGAWYVDRYAPGEFDSFDFGGEDVLRHGIRASDQQTNSFYNYQGRKYDLGMTGASVSVSIDLWVDGSWEGADRNAGIWATGRDSSGGISAYPIMAFRNDGISTYDYFGGAWESAVSFSSSDFGSWVNLAFTLVPGVGVEYFVNGVSVGVFADTDTMLIDNVILNGFNYGEDYDIYWDNFTAMASTVIPLPGAAGMALAGLGMIGLRRRR